MAQLVDTGLINAYQNILNNQRGMDSLVQSIGSSIGGVGSAAINRKKTAGAVETQAELRDKELADQQTQIAQNLARLRMDAEKGTQGAQESAAIQDALSQGEQKLSTIGAMRERLQGIGGVGFMNMPEKRAELANILQQKPVVQSIDAIGQARALDIESNTRAKENAAKRAQEVADMEKKFKYDKEIAEIKRNEVDPIKQMLAETALAQRQQQLLKSKQVPSTISTPFTAGKEIINAAEELEKTMSELGIDNIEGFYTPQVANAIAESKGDAFDRAWGTIKETWYGISDEDKENAAKIMAAAEALAAPIRNKRFGAALSKNDIKLAAMSFPVAGDTVEQMQTKLDTLVRLTKKGMEGLKRQAEAGGADVSGLQINEENTMPMQSEMIETDWQTDADFK